MAEIERNPFFNDEINLTSELKNQLEEINSGKSIEINDYGKGKRAVRRALNCILAKPFELRESKVDGSLWVKTCEIPTTTTLKKKILNQIIAAKPYEFFHVDVPVIKTAYARVQLSDISKKLGVKIKTRLSKENKRLMVKISNGQNNAHTVLQELNKGK